MVLIKVSSEAWSRSSLLRVHLVDHKIFLSLVKKPDFFGSKRDDLALFIWVWSSHDSVEGVE